MLGCACREASPLTKAQSRRMTDATVRLRRPAQDANIPVYVIYNNTYFLYTLFYSMITCTLHIPVSTVYMLLGNVAPSA